MQNQSGEEFQHDRQLACCSCSVSSASLASLRTDGMTGVPARTFRGVTFFEAVGRRVEADTAPLLLEQDCCFHILDTDDGAALGQNRFGAVELIVRKFQPSLVSGELRAALFRLPSHILAEILEADVLLVANEGIVFDFVAVRLEVPGETPETAPLGSNVLCHRLRRAHLKAAKICAGAGAQR